MEAIKNHKIICDARKLLEITGVQKVESSNETQVVCITETSPLVITGKNMHVKKLDTEQGVVEIEGEIDGLKYQQKHKNFLKRVFK